MCILVAAMLRLLIPLPSLISSRCSDFLFHMPHWFLFLFLSAGVGITNILRVSGLWMYDRWYLISRVQTSQYLPAVLSCLWSCGAGHLFDLPAGLWNSYAGQYCCAKSLSSVKPIRTTWERWVENLSVSVLSWSVQLVWIWEDAERYGCVGGFLHVFSHLCTVGSIFLLALRITSIL